MKKETVKDAPPSRAEAIRWARYVLSHPEQSSWTGEEAFAEYRREFPAPLTATVPEFLAASAIMASADGIQ